MRNRLTDALSGQKADYLEIRLEEYESTNIHFQGKELEKISSSQEIGGNVRALVKGRWGFVTFNRWDDLEKKVKEAIEIATLIGDQKSYFAPVEPVVEQLLPEIPESGRDFRKVSLTEKASLMKNYSDLIVDFSPQIQSSIVDYTDRYSTVH